MYMHREFEEQDEHEGNSREMDKYEHNADAWYKLQVTMISNCSDGLTDEGDIAILRSATNRQFHRAL